MASTSCSRVSLGKISIMLTRASARFEPLKLALSLFGSSSLFDSLLEFEQLSDRVINSELCFVECEVEAAHGWCELSRENAEHFRWYANPSKLNSDIFPTCQPSLLLLCWWIHSDLELYSMPEILPGHWFIAFTVENIIKIVKTAKKSLQMRKTGYQQRYQPKLQKALRDDYTVTAAKDTLEKSGAPLLRTHRQRWHKAFVFFCLSCACERPFIIWLLVVCEYFFPWREIGDWKLETWAKSLKFSTRKKGSPSLLIQQPLIRSGPPLRAKREERASLFVSSPANTW